MLASDALPPRFRSKFSLIELILIQSHHALEFARLHAHAHARVRVWARLMSPTATRLILCAWPCWPAGRAGSSSAGMYGGSSSASMCGGGGSSGSLKKSVASYIIISVSAYRAGNVAGRQGREAAREGRGGR